jgi:hypothetical protein
MSGRFASLSRPEPASDSRRFGGGFGGSSSEPPARPRFVLGAGAANLQNTATERAAERAAERQFGTSTPAVAAPAAAAAASAAASDWNDDGDAFDRKVETEVDASGMKIVTEYKTTERGQRVRFLTRLC